MRTLLVVSADLSDGPSRDARGPVRDYDAIAEHLGADILDRGCIRRTPGGRDVASAVGAAVAQAWLAARRHHRYDVILSDGEHIGIPLACFLKQARVDVAHVMIGHRLSTPKKLPFFRVARVQTHISRVIVHSSYQRRFATQRLGFQPAQVCLVPYQVDASFWRPQPIPEERLVASAGLEHRDYQTFFRAVEGLDADVVVGAASHWSRQPNTALGIERPANVTVGSFDYAALRDVFARSSVVVVPLLDVDFQAGVTTILEAMAMGKAVVVTHTVGQTDVVRDRRAATRGMIARSQPEGVLRANAWSAGAVIEPNGLYVPPGDPGTLRRAIVYLLDHPEVRAELGAAARRLVERLLTVDQFAERVARVVEQAAGSRHQTGQRADRTVLVRPTHRRGAREHLTSAYAG